LALAQTHSQGSRVQSLEAVSPNRSQQRFRLIWREGLHLPGAHLGRVDERRHIPANQSPPKGLAEGATQNGPDVLNRARCETIREFAVQETLHLLRRKPRKTDPSQSRNQMSAHVARVAGEGARANGCLRRVLEPGGQKLSDCFLLGCDW